MSSPLSRKMLNDKDKKNILKTNSLPHWGFWGTSIWGVVLAGSYIFLQLLFIGIYIGMTEGAVPTTGTKKSLLSLQFNGFVISISILFSAIICCALLIAIIKLKRGSSIKAYLGFVHVKINQVLRWVVLAIALAVVYDMINIVLGRPVVPEFMIALYSSAKYPFVFWLAMVVAAPLFEECLFRGFLLKGYSASFLRPTGAVIVTSVLWAVIHLQYDLYEVVTIFIFGCILAVARLQTGSVLLTIGLHSLFNIVSTIEIIILLASGTS